MRCKRGEKENLLRYLSYDKVKEDDSNSGEENRGILGYQPLKWEVTNHEKEIQKFIILKD